MWTYEKKIRRRSHCTQHNESMATIFRGVVSTLSIHSSIFFLAIKYSCTTSSSIVQCVYLSSCAWSHVICTRTLDDGWTSNSKKSGWAVVIASKAEEKCFSACYLERTPCLSFNLPVPQTTLSIASNLLGRLGMDPLAMMPALSDSWRRKNLLLEFVKKFHRTRKSQFKSFWRLIHDNMVKFAALNWPNYLRLCRWLIHTSCHVLISSAKCF